MYQKPAQNTEQAYQRLMQASAVNQLAQPPQPTFFDSLKAFAKKYGLAFGLGVGVGAGATYMMVRNPEQPEEEKPFSLHLQ
jgi:hypothetical protein